jgi:hypothetical protein
MGHDEYYPPEFVDHFDRMVIITWFCRPRFSWRAGVVPLASMLLPFWRSSGMQMTSYGRVPRIGWSTWSGLLSLDGFNFVYKAPENEVRAKWSNQLLYIHMISFSLVRVLSGRTLSSKLSLFTSNKLTIQSLTGMAIREVHLLYVLLRYVLVYSLQPSIWNWL